MKTSTTFLAVSLLVNAALIAAIAFRPAVPVTPSAVSPAAAAASAPADPAPTPAAWGSLQSTDLATERDRLRAEGFPPAIVRAILMVQIRDQFAAQRRELDAATGKQEFWKPYDADPKTAEARRALALEEQKMLRALLGRDADTPQIESLQRQFPGFASEKIGQMVAIRQRYDEERIKLLGAGGRLTSDQTQQLRALEKAMHAEYAAVLTPAEMEEYDFRLGSEANQLRARMGNFEPTEAEFRALYRLQSGFDDVYRYAGPLTPDEMRARSAAMEKLKADIAAELGPVRAEEYRRASDYEFQRTLRLTERLQFPTQTANDLYALQKEFSDRRLSMYRGATSREQVTELAKGLESEANARVEALLNGDKRAIDAYKANCGQWLKMTPSQPRTTVRTGTVSIPGK